jgi:uncharacterized membrane protein YqjE
MASSTPSSGGLVNSVRVLGDGLLGILYDRLELLTTELHEEKFRLIQIFIWISAAVFSGMMAITFASLALVYLFWEGARLTALIGLTVVYGGALLGIIITFRRYLSRQPRPFAATRAEIGEDRACIRPET